mmetsp:Transcript_145225/g.368523  ORF Transcript_145225/g.368523 Transcript_145225/m.368523 type:complete len:684 (+) Transcript_145225:115-2166(+)
MFRFAAAATTFAALIGSADGQGYHRSEDRTEHVLSQRMHEVMELSALPAELDWRTKDGRNYTTVSRNQHIPMYCGACYSFGSTSALADRIRIARGGTGREINLAMQVVLNCDLKDLGCSGGDALSVYRFIHKSGGIPDETCQPYSATGHDTGRHCEAEDVCRTCDEEGCRAASDYEVYGIEEYGTVSGEDQMKAELQRGPLACAISTPKAFIDFLGWDIYEDKTHENQIDHIISVVGYGSEDGKDYWIVRNSWGTYWGYYGWARVARGKNNIMIETDCAWATPSNGGRPVWRHVDVRDGKEKHQEDEPKPEVLPLAAPEQSFLAASGAPPARSPEERRPCRAARNDWAAYGGERVTSPRPHELVEESALPKEWDWRNVSGRSWVSWNTNENLPHGGCASCWAQGVASALSDRIAVHRQGAWPQIGLAPQMLLNCKAGGTCDGGDPAGAYAYISRFGITDETCQNYQATEFTCDGPHICRNCAPGGEHGLIWPGTCVAVKQPIVWFLSEYGSVRGAGPMKAEIYQRGPIGCGVDATPGFRSYRGGVYSEARDGVQLNMQVSIAGWGQEGRATEYWVGRNSWGTYWGEGGWFRLQMHKDNLGVETDCDWGVPSTHTEVPSTRLASPQTAEEEAEALLLGGWSAPAQAAAAVGAAAGLAAALAAMAVRSRREGDSEEEAAPYVLVQ